MWDTRWRGVTLSHLQFADDTLIIGKKSSKNIWTIKTLMQLFESVLGLKVNFNKSQLIGLNVVWVQEAVGFLNCKVGEFPFIYLGLPICVDARSKNTWRPVVDKIRHQRVLLELLKPCSKKFFGVIRREIKKKSLGSMVQYL